MRVLCDVHIPYRLVSQLRELGIDATHVNRVLEGSRTKDSAIRGLRRCQQNAADHEGR